MSETVAAAIMRGRRMLEAKGIATAALDVRLLMQAVSGFDHAQLIAAPEHVLSDFEADDFERFLNRRCNAEPVSRILGKREFYGRDFIVTPDVLDPRPDTEALIDLCLRLMPADVPFRFADMGAGSGAIAVTLLAERPLSTGVAARSAFCRAPKCRSEWCSEAARTFRERLVLVFARQFRSHCFEPTLYHKSRYRGACARGEVP
jgi:HemK-like putative methylase